MSDQTDSSVGVKGEPLHAAILRALRGPIRPALADERRLWTNVDLLEAIGRLGAEIAILARDCYAPVAVVGPKSALAVAAVLGALFSGRPFSTFDPIEKPLRITRRLQALRPSVVVDLDGRSGDYGLDSQIPVLSLTSGLPVRSPEGPALDSCGLAYVLFTSGSTGEPRGVAVGHRAAVLARNRYLRTAKIGPGDRVASDIPLIFDVSTLDVLGGLAAGACVDLIPLKTAETAGALHQHLSRVRATTAFTVPTVADLMFAEERPLPDLRVLLLTGEKIGARLADRLCRVGVTAINAYGMTEAPWVTIGNLAHGRNVLNFPRPSDPVAMRLADDGEIVLSGPGLYSGIIGPKFDYRRDPGPVAEYHTGDFGRKLPDGRVEFLGRRDRHVRHEGFRIELSEIESYIEAVAPNALAYAFYDEAAQRLSVWIAPRPGATLPDLSEIRAIATKVMPDFMSPHRWYTLDKAPRTATGKKHHGAVAENA